MKKKSGKLFEQVREQVIRIILDQGLKPHDPIPSEGELGTRYGVSRMTSKLALQALQDEGVVYRLPRRGTFLADIDREELRQMLDDPSTSYASSERNDSIQIALIVPGIDDYIGKMLISIEKAAAEEGMSVVIKVVQHEQEEAAAVQWFSERKEISGILLFPVDRTICRDHLLRLKLQKYPVVILDRLFEEIHFDSVSHDHYKGAYDMTSYLLQLGHREIGFISGPLLEVKSRKERYQGYLDALLEGKVDVQHEVILIRDEPWDQKEGHQERVQWIKSFLEGSRRLTAVLCADDYLAVSAMHAALQLHKRIPQDLSISGFADHNILEYAPVPMTTVAQPMDNFGKEAVRLLVNRLIQPESKSVTVRLPTILVIRDSVHERH
ncbi:GntR family transcriptional regulator [Paenibacillus lemnae]|uniref:Substrate-binding domain-containing protein n=1 Tax=Paenibacillus lemnae TaxID=1330551 RepID=A0A848M7C2_PAELE|nr:GntR family transcriptional regulator [Paenibacillus lemnae]NMO95982.1 substrate-binding domain-containing protein [Paenibacillus lemnae]